MLSSFSSKEFRFRDVFIQPKMHRAYQPILPCSNKYLQQKWDKATYETHKKKLQMARHVVDTSMPPTYGHLHLKFGKLKLEKDRLSIIERDNRLLLEKIAYIMRTRGRIDNKNDYETKSLSRGKQEQELLRVSQENHAIVERVIKCEPHYKVQWWHNDWQKNEKYMDSIARYPRGLCKSQNHKEQKPTNKIPKKDRQNDKCLKEGCLTDKMERKEWICLNKEENDETIQREDSVTIQWTPMKLHLLNFNHSAVPGT